MIPEVLVNALRGISTCSTACDCCEMHRRIAENALAEYAKLAVPFPVALSLTALVGNDAVDEESQ
jgi:hypothetical protein